MSFENDYEKKVFLPENDEIEEKISDVYLENIDAKTGLTVKYKDEMIQLTSQYDSSVLIDKWIEQNDISNYRSIAFIFGIADGSYVRRLREMNKEMLIIVYEPSLLIYRFFEENINISRIAESEDMTIVVVGNENYNLLYKMVTGTLGYESLKYFNFYVSPNYNRIFLEEIDIVMKLIIDYAALVRVNKNTIIHFNSKVTNNISNNIIDYMEQRSLTGLVDTFEEIDKEKIPAIIVAAGPSLDKNIMELKRAKGKAFIIAVDTALNALAKANITPDIAVTVDPKKPVMLFEHERNLQVPLVFSLGSNNEILNVHKGIRIYQDSFESCISEFNKKFNKSKLRLETGGSVANDAYSLAQKLGFKTIIFVGQDLAYPNNQEHSTDSYGDKKNNSIVDDGKKYFYVDDIYGNKVKTEYNMNMYRKWFEQAVKIYSYIRYIDATEGGAKKEGMEIMTLRDAINETCIENEIINFDEIISRTELRFTDEERKEILEYVANYDSEMQKISDKIKSGIKLYEKLAEFNNKHSYGKGFSNTFAKITELNNWLTDAEETKYLTLYVAEKDYEIKAKVYDEQENIYEEIKSSINSGLDLLREHSKAIELILKDMKSTMERAKEMLAE